MTTPKRFQKRRKVDTDPATRWARMSKGWIRILGVCSACPGMTCEFAPRNGFLICRHCSKPPHVADPPKPLEGDKWVRVFHVQDHHTGEVETRFEATPKPKKRGAFGGVVDLDQI